MEKVVSAAENKMFEKLSVAKKPQQKKKKLSKVNNASRLQVKAN